MNIFRISFIYLRIVPCKAIGILGQDFIKKHQAIINCIYPWNRNLGDAKEVPTCKEYPLAEVY